MATRTIVTSQPDVACDVCARRLLRGEQPDVFVGAGRRRIVCELCAPRAAHEGWLRETDSQSLGLAPPRPRRAGNLLERLRRVTKPPLEAPGSTLPIESASMGAPHEHDGQPYDVYAGAEQVDAEPSPVDALPVSSPTATTEARAESLAAYSPEGEAPPSETAAASTGDSYVRQAIEVFNASEFPRRVAGVARSLGAPSVSVRSAEHLSSVVRIVVAWELCWYRYEVDLSEPSAQVQMLAQGTELAELTREDCLANATAESGALTLATG